MKKIVGRKKKVKYQRCRECKKRTKNKIKSTKKINKKLKWKQRMGWIHCELSGPLWNLTKDELRNLLNKIWWQYQLYRDIRSHKVWQVGGLWISRGKIMRQMWSFLKYHEKIGIGPKSHYNLILESIKTWKVYNYIDTLGIEVVPVESTWTYWVRYHLKSDTEMFLIAD